MIKRSDDALGGGGRNRKLFYLLHCRKKTHTHISIYILYISYCSTLLFYFNFLFVITLCMFIEFFSFARYSLHFSAPSSHIEFNSLHRFFFWSANAKRLLNGSLFFTFFLCCVFFLSSFLGSTLFIRQLCCRCLAPIGVMGFGDSAWNSDLEQQRWLFLSFVLPSRAQYRIENVPFDCFCSGPIFHVNSISHFGGVHLFTLSSFLPYSCCHCSVVQMNWIHFISSANCIWSSNATEMWWDPFRQNVHFAFFTK